MPYDSLLMMIHHYAAGANNRDEPFVYNPGVYLRNLQQDGMFVRAVSSQDHQTLTITTYSNGNATFYTDTEKSPHLRGRRAIVPCVSILKRIYDLYFDFGIIGLLIFSEVQAGNPSFW